MSIEQEIIEKYKLIQDLRAEMEELFKQLENSVESDEYKPGDKVLFLG